MLCDRTRLACKSEPGVIGTFFTHAEEVRYLQMLLTRLGRILSESPPSGPRDEVVALVESLSSLQVQICSCGLLTPSLLESMSPLRQSWPGYPECQMAIAASWTAAGDARLVCLQATMERLDIAAPRGTAASLDTQSIFGPLVISWTENVKVCAPPWTAWKATQLLALVCRPPSVCSLPRYTKHCICNGLVVADLCSCTG